MFGRGKSNGSFRCACSVAFAFPNTKTSRGLQAQSRLQPRAKVGVDRDQVWLDCLTRAPGERSSRWSCHSVVTPCLCLKVARRPETILLSFKLLAISTQDLPPTRHFKIALLNQQDSNPHKTTCQSQSTTAMPALQMSTRVQSLLSLPLLQSLLSHQRPAWLT